MANTPKADETEEIIGMTVPGIEDYTNDFDEHSDSSKDHEISLSQKQSLIRHSFQVLLPIGSPNTSVKLGLPLSINDITDDESDYEIDNDNNNNNNELQLSSDQKIEEEPITTRTTTSINDIQLFEEFKKDIEKQKNKSNNISVIGQYNLPNSPQTIHKKQHSVLELDEEDDEGSSSSINSSDSSDSDDSDDTSDSDDDDSDRNSNTSSPWGTDPEDFDEVV
eukprot:17384_1